MKAFKQAKLVMETLVELRGVLDLAGSRPGNSEAKNVWLSDYQIGLLLSLVEQALA